MAIENWFQTYSGKLINITNPKPDDIDIIDIAHALSMTCRFGGHCRDFYSVAEHSVLVCNLGSFERSKLLDHDPPKEKNNHSLALLLHDAAEAYIGDLITPLKQVLKGSHELETRWLQAIEQKFDLGTRLSDPDASIKAADLRMLSVEITSLYDHADPAWWSKFAPPQPIDLYYQPVNCWTPTTAHLQFLSLFRHHRAALGCTTF